MCCLAHPANSSSARGLMRGFNRSARLTQNHSEFRSCRWHEGRLEQGVDRLWRTLTSTASKSFRRRRCLRAHMIEPQSYITLRRTPIAPPPPRMEKETISPLTNSPNRRSNTPETPISTRKRLSRRTRTRRRSKARTVNCRRYRAISMDRRCLLP